MTQIFIPVLSTAAGSTLTTQNWQDAQIKTVSYSLAALLIKPGIHLLKNIVDLKTYLGWQETFVLNASMLTLDQHGAVSMRSTLDGSRISIQFNELLELVAQLKPDYFILPQGYSSVHWLSLPESILLFFSSSDVPEQIDARCYGVYVDYDKTDLKQLQGLEKKIYIMGEFNATDIQLLSTINEVYIESNKPAQDAYLGLLYTSKEHILDITDKNYAHQFDVIDKNCRCPTCQQQFTRAYLHHLFQHTPLLCQRLLVQHNIYQVKV